MASLQNTTITGNASVTGNVSATNFVGSGSQLTGVGRTIIVATRSSQVATPITSGQYLPVLTRSGNANVVVTT